MRYKLISFLMIIGVSSFATGTPHKHGTRAHNHPLPKQGVNHRHGNGAYGTFTSRSEIVQPPMNKKTISSNDDGFVDINTNQLRKINYEFFVNKKSCMQKLCGKYLKIIYDSDGYRYPGKVWIIDYDNETKFYRGFKIGSQGDKVRLGEYWYKIYLSKDAKKIKFTYFDAFDSNKIVSNSVYYRIPQGTKLSNGREIRIVLENYRSNYKVEFRNDKNLTIKSPVSKSSLELDMENLFVDLNLGRPASYTTKWYKDDGNNSERISGKGKMYVVLEDNSDITKEIKIIGNFNKGILVGNGKLWFSIGKCYKKGIVFCKVAENEKMTIPIKASTNIKKIIKRLSNKVIPKMYARALPKLEKLKNQSPSISSSYSSSPSSSSSSSSSSKSNKSYRCSFKCYNFGGVTGWGKEGGSEHKFEVSASSKNEAKKLGLPYAKKSCKNAGYDGVLSQWGSGSIACR